MAYLTTLMTNCRAAVAAVWTDVPANGIWESEHEELVPWDLLTPPMAAIVLSEVQATDDFGASNASYVVGAQFFYAGEVSGPSTSLRTKAEALRDALLSTGVTDAQVLDVTRLSWSAELAANAIMIEKQFAHRVCVVEAMLVVGEVLT